MNIDQTLAVALLDPDRPQPQAVFDHATGQATVTVGEETWELDPVALTRLHERITRHNLLVASAAAEAHLVEAAEAAEKARVAALRSSWSLASLGLVEAPEGSGRWRIESGDGAWATLRAGDFDDDVLVDLFADESGAAAMTVRVSFSARSGTSLRLERWEAGNVPWGLPDTNERRARVEALRAASPLAGIDTNDLVALLNVAPAYAEWKAKLAAEVAEAEGLWEERKAQKEAAAKEWKRKSRDKNRIPNAALDQLCKNLSSVSYDSTGYPTSGWRVEPVIVVGEERPRGLEDDDSRWGRRGGTKVGLSRVHYVVRLEHFEARHRASRRSAPGYKFYESDLEKVRKALPGCVVKMPEGGGTIFIASDQPEYVEALDAALVEWVLAGPPGGDD